MALFGRILGRKRPVDPAAAADREWSERVRGIAVLQTAAEQQVTRQRMEGELDAQRERRPRGSAPEA